MVVSGRSATLPWAAERPDLEEFFGQHRPAWMARGLCRGQLTDLFFPTQGGDLETPKGICARCPVQAECLAYTLANPEPLWDLGRDLRQAAGAAEAAECVTGPCQHFVNGCAQLTPIRGHMRLQIALPGYAGLPGETKRDYLRPHERNRPLKLARLPIPPLRRGCRTEAQRASKAPRTVPQTHSPAASRPRRQALGPLFEPRRPGQSSGLPSLRHSRVGPPNSGSRSRSQCQIAV